MNVLLGIGNALRGDDGAGPRLARTFRRDGWVSLDAGTMPENFTSRIRQEHPDIVVLVDAADMGLPPGEFRRIPLPRVADLSLGTHAGSLTPFISFIASFVKEVVLIGIQPKEIRDQASLSPAVTQGIEHLTTVLQQEDLSNIPQL
jgi:hydrogenase maturation protease